MEDCKIHKNQIYITLFLCIVPIIVCVIMGISLVYAFLLSTTFSSLMCMKNGISFKDIKSMVFSGINECKSLYIVILLIGATVSVWLSSGVVPTMIYYGLEYMKGMNLLFASFILISISSVFMGTAVGTISTIGVAIIGIGKGFGIPTHILVGVIVSGAFLADKISPISGLLNLTLTTTEITYKEAIKSAIYTIVPTMIICVIIYYFIGVKYQGIEGANTSIELTKAMSSEFFISPYLLLLPILMIVLSVVGVKSIYCMWAGIIGGGIVSIIYQRTSIFQLLNYIFFGFDLNTNSKALNETLVSGGVISMVSVVLIVIGAIALSSILQGTGIINYLTKEMIEKISNRKQLILKTGIISSTLTFITCDQTIGIVIPSRLLKSKYKEIGVDNNVLARTISDTGTIIAPLMPWNINSLIITLVTGVSCVEYAPFAILCFIAPIMTTLFAFNDKN